MITNKEQKVIKKVLGKHYSPKVLKELDRLQIFNTKNERFLPENIRKIVAGTWENEAVEIAILNLVKRTISKKKKQEEKRIKMLQS